MRASILKTAAVLGGCALISGAASLSASAAPTGDKPPPPKRECFDKDFVTGFSAHDDETVYVRVGTRDIWELKLFTSCPDVDWRQSIGLKTHVSPWVCSAMDLELIVPSHGVGSGRCMVSHIRKLSPAEIEAMPKKDRP